jgi:predicted nucleic acid-binding protein
MPRYFVDTWFLIARLHRADSDHDRAQRLSTTLTHTALVTHDGVLTEFLTFFAEYGALWRLKAAQLVRSLAANGVEVVPQDRTLFLDALSRYEQRPDKEYSLVDCMSMVLMERRGIRHVLTNDHHFAQAGFIIVNQ